MNGDLGRAEPGREDPPPAAGGSCCEADSHAASAGASAGLPSAGCAGGGVRNLHFSVRQGFPQNLGALVLVLLPQVTGPVLQPLDEPVEIHACERPSQIKQGRRAALRGRSLGGEPGYRVAEGRLGGGVVRL